jgi:hypothetical protein
VKKAVVAPVTPPRPTFRSQTALVLEETRRNSTSTTRLALPEVEATDTNANINTIVPDVALNSSTSSTDSASSYNSVIQHDLSLDPSESADVTDDFSSDSSYSSDDDDNGLGGGPSTSMSLSMSMDDSYVLEADGGEEKSDKALDGQGQGQALHTINKSWQGHDLVSGPSIDSSGLANASADSLEETETGGRAKSWQALDNRGKQRLDLGKNQKRLDLDLAKSQDPAENKRPPHGRDYPTTQSPFVTHSNTSNAGAFASSRSSSMQQEIKFKPAPTKSSTRMQELIGRFERQDASSASEKPPIRGGGSRSPIRGGGGGSRSSARKAHGERENRQDIGDRVDSLSSSFSGSAAEASPSRTPHSFFRRTHPRVESSEIKATMSSISTVEHVKVKVNPKLADMDRSESTDADAREHYVDFALARKMTTNPVVLHQPAPHENYVDFALARKITPPPVVVHEPAPQEHYVDFALASKITTTPVVVHQPAPQENYVDFTLASKITTTPVVVHQPAPQENYVDFALAREMTTTPVAVHEEPLPIHRPSVSSERRFL